MNLANDQLDAQILTHLLQSSTCACFEQYLAHPQEARLHVVHVEDCNKCIKICASRWSLEKVILRCTVSET